jgi:hypothetical protein
VTIDVTINGSGFGSGATASFRLAGADDPKVRTNSTTLVSSSQLIANITIDADATPDFRDVVVSFNGKQGIGSEAFTVLNIGVMDLPGFTATQAWGVNASGVATADGSPTSECTPLAFTWSTAGGASPLPLPPGYCRNQSKRINDRGVVAAIVSTAATINGPATQVAIYTPDGEGGWTIEVLPKPQPDVTWLSTAGFTNTGEIVSYWRNADGSTSDAWYWSTGSGWQRLMRPAGAPSCSPHGMNDRGEIVGLCNGQNVYWATPTSAPVPIPTPVGATAASIFCINNSGVFAGSYSTKRGTAAARWVPNGSGGWTIQDLGMAGEVRSINDDGAVTVANNGKWWYLAPGGSATQLDPLSRSGGAMIYSAGVANKSADGVTWIAGYGTETQNAPYRALWWRQP